MTALQEVMQVVATRHDYARQWKARTGGKILGYFCTYVPEEIIYAANILPVRILGGLEPQDASEAHIASMYCPFCRDCLAQGLLGRYDYLDGIVTTRTCQHIHQAFESWLVHLPVSYSYFVGMPFLVSNPLAGEFFRNELADFQRSLETWTGKPIAPEALSQAVELYNTARRVMHQLYELRRQRPPLLSGSEAMAAVLSFMLMEKREAVDLLQRLVHEVSQRKDGPKDAPRLMVIGSESHDLGLFQLIEAAGGNVVIEEMCTGSRYFWNQVPPGTDLLSAIATRYLERPRCPLRDVTERRRLEHILNLTKEYQVQGVVLVQQKFCDPHEFDIPVIHDLLQRQNIPSYFLELDVTLHKGTAITRTEAFLEMLQLQVG